MIKHTMLVFKEGEYVFFSFLVCNFSEDRFYSLPEMTEERLILDERILPELKKFCRERNFDVQIIDLNIDDEQFNYEDWKSEIKVAHQESTGVGFIVS